MDESKEIKNLELLAPKQSKLKLYLYLLVVILLAVFLRVYKLDQIPPSLNWDEAAAGYNAFTIANWGQDEWGQTFPLIFTSFRDDKHPVHIYTAAVFVKLFGLSDFTTRLPAAVFGVLAVILIFFLTKKLLKSNLAAFFASFLLAISPYNIQFSRGLWEINFALFYLILGLFLFYLGLEKKNYLLTGSFVAFIVSMLSYHSAKVVVPAVLLTLIVFYFKQLIKLKEKFYLGLGIFLLFIILMVLNPKIAGLARVNQNKFSEEQIKKTEIYQKTKNQTLAYGEIVGRQYLSHFSFAYLYEKGDPTPRNSIKVLGEFYKFEAPLFLLGLIFLIWSRSKVSMVLLVWLLSAPLPSALVQGAPNASRALFMMGVMQLVEGFAVAKILNWLSKGKFSLPQVKLTNFKYGLGIALIIISLISLKEFTDYYFGNYAKKDAIDWQYGMKEVVNFVQKYPDYSRVYMTDVRSQPYIFFLYYLKYPLPKYLSTVQLNQDERSYKYNTVYSFDKYQFGGWDVVQSMPDPGLVYVVEDSKYGGLAHLKDFARYEKIKFPDGGAAFYIVSKY